MKGNFNVFTTLLVAIIIGGMVLTFYPYIEGLMGHIGGEMATGANYTVSTTAADTVKNTVWGVGGPLLILAMMVMIGAPLLAKQHQHQV